MMLAWLACLAAANGGSHAQEARVGPPAAPLEDEWTFSAAVYGFDPPGEHGYLSPIVRADRGALHVEARYNYEELDTASLFFGRNFELGGEVELLLTPMVGAVVGEIAGVAPGLELDVAWRQLSFSSESEYVIDFDDEGDDFLYTWNELAFAPADWVRFGLVAQRTRIFDQELEVDRGVLLGFAFRELWLDLYLFNPDVDEPYGGFALGVDF